MVERLSRPAKKLGYLIVYVVPLLVATGAWWGGAHPAAAWLTPVVTFCLIPLLDLLVGEDPTNPSEDDALLSRDPWYRAIAWLFVPVFWATLLFVLWLSVHGSWGPLAFAGNAVSMGILSGIGIVVAHELGHKASRSDKLLAKALLHPVFYAHFTREHNLGHHLMVATPEDPSSARFREGFWRFYPRTVGGTFRHAWQLEATRLTRLGKNSRGLENETWRNVLFPFALLAAAWLALGPAAALFFGLQAWLGFSLLELVNYIEHYGLERRLLPGGKWERVTPLHSWNSNHLVTNCFLFHLQRHSDHHAWPARWYQTLRNFPEAPQLPTGYAGMILLALVPPLWFRVMDPRVREFRARQAGVEAVEGEGVVA